MRCSSGSTLGPLLFLIYINDFRYCFNKSTASHFADDTCIMYSNNKIKSLETILNTELKTAATWLKANRLPLNIKKSKFLLFHSKRKKVLNHQLSVKLDGNKMALETSVQYLGMTIDNNMSWDNHINNLGKKLSRANGILCKLRTYMPKKTLISVYYAIFHSQVLYGCLMWSLSTLKNINSINVLQKKCLRIMKVSPYNSHPHIIQIG